MKVSGYIKKNPDKGFSIRFFVCFTLSMFLFAASPWPTFANDKGKEERIRITADTLVAEKEKRYATFSGNVTASYNGATLTSDRLEIHYAEKSKQSSDATPPFEKMVAEGNVVVKFDGKVATAGKVVYTTADDMVVLTGGTPKIQTGSSFITGKKIKVRRRDGKMTVISDKSNRVEALFYPEDKDSARSR